MFPGRIILLALNLAGSRPAAPPGAPTRPARGMFEFWIRQVRLKKIVVRMKKILIYLRNNKANNLMFKKEIAGIRYADLDADVDKFREVQKDALGNPPAERPRVGALKTPVTRRQMPRVAYEDAGCEHAEDARLEVALVAVGAERASGYESRSAAARALGGATGALGDASDRVGAQIRSSPVESHFS